MLIDRIVLRRSRIGGDGLGQGHFPDFKLRRSPMKRILFALAAVAVLAVGGIALSHSAHADGGSGGAGQSCSGPNC